MGDDLSCEPFVGVCTLADNHWFRETALWDACFGMGAGGTHKLPHPPAAGPEAAVASCWPSGVYTDINNAGSLVS